MVASMTPLRVLCAIGTRPEAIKMAPVIQALRSTEWADTRVLATAQHRHLLDQVLHLFDIQPDVDLDAMRPRQSLPDLTARLLGSLDTALAAECPDIVLAQGDTTTVFATALACFYRHIPFGHVEAGLRSGNPESPFPEEMNRVLAGRLARWHFAPTTSARDNLLREGVRPDTIAVTGNTVIDALLQIAKVETALPVQLDASKRLILLTAHRRENFARLESICSAVTTLVERNPDVAVLYPVHPNPRVLETVQRMLGKVEGVTLCEPLDYASFVQAMKRSFLIVTDSGGVQEEAPALGRPVLVIRTETERPEAVDAGVVRLVGIDTESITREVQRLLDDRAAYAAMAQGVSPYGDGHAATRIVDILANSHVVKERVTA
jgi:UDP-N-acetylglucosamine 2-epimerase (non-hydrolysing)